MLNMMGLENTILSPVSRKEDTFCESTYVSSLEKQRGQNPRAKMQVGASRGCPWWAKGGSVHGETLSDKMEVFWSWVVEMCVTT